VKASVFKAGDDGRALLVDGTQQSIALSECGIVQQTGNALLDNFLLCALALSVKRLDLSRGKAVLCAVAALRPFQAPAPVLR
jgi:hypothetical protein